MPRLARLGTSRSAVVRRREVNVPAATFAAAMADVYKNGQVLPNPKTVMPHKNPALAVAETARRDLLRYAREFAITPLAESLLARFPRDDDDEDDPYA